MPACTFSCRDLCIPIGLGIPLPPTFIVRIIVGSLHMAPHPPVNRLRRGHTPLYCFSQGISLSIRAPHHQGLRRLGVIYHLPCPCSEFPNPHSTLDIPQLTRHAQQDATVHTDQSILCTYDSGAPQPRRGHNVQRARTYGLRAEGVYGGDIQSIDTNN